jgi:hypothetical protein
MREKPPYGPAIEAQNKTLTAAEMSAELAKDARTIDYDHLLNRAGNQDEGAKRRVYYVAMDELARMPGGIERRKQATNEYYTSHGPDGDEVWWIARRLNELMGSPLKLDPLPEWDRASND